MCGLNWRHCEYRLTIWTVSVTLWCSLHQQTKVNDNNKNQYQDPRKAKNVQHFLWHWFNVLDFLAKKWVNIANHFQIMILQSPQLSTNKIPVVFTSLSPLLPLRHKNGYYYKTPSDTPLHIVIYGKLSLTIGITKIILGISVPCYFNWCWFELLKSV